jgi:hypothetical protein
MRTTVKPLICGSQVSTDKPSVSTHILLSDLTITTSQSSRRGRELVLTLNRQCGGGGVGNRQSLQDYRWSVRDFRSSAIPLYIENNKTGLPNILWQVMTKNRQFSRDPCDTFVLLKCCFTFFLSLSCMWSNELWYIFFIMLMMDWVEYVQGSSRILHSVKEQYPEEVH